MSPGHIAAAVAAVLIAAGVLWRRRRLSTERVLIGLAIALALGVYASGVLSKLPDPKQVIEDVAVALGPWTYALVGVMAFLETGAFVGLIAPGETVVIAGGVIAGQGEIQLIPLIGLVWVCAVLGDSASFYVGRRLGRSFLERHGPRVKITHERLEQVDRYFDRHGGKTILIGRFIGLVRAIAPFIAGSSGLSYRSFLPYSVVGTGLWATAFCVLGYVFWRSFDRVADIAGKAVFGFGLTVAVIVGVVVLYRRRAGDPPVAAGQPRTALRQAAVRARGARLPARGAAAEPRARAAAALPLGAPDPGRTRARADDHAGGRRRRHVRLRPLRGHPQRLVRADALRPRAARRRRRRPDATSASASPRASRRSAASRP